ncbi:MAG: hypothetical protein IPK50_02570 [Fibrobacterota bacterium]|nr:hypothetical protein [Fibrobacterota bacterium]QQS05780.1 MAG: hypothetical protein IPK50_02570 [Fibrobacterota bacterium]
MSNSPAWSRLLILSQGRLESIAPDGTSKPLESAFARELIERQERTNQNNAWKYEDRESSGPFSRSNIWGGTGKASPIQPAWFLSVFPGFQSGEFFYTLRVSIVMALLRIDAHDHRERRILHRQDFHEGGIACDPTERRMAMSVHSADGSAHLVQCDHEATIRKELTGGDSIDANPSFSRQIPSRVLYQSTGIARGENGHILAHGPTSIQAVDLKTRDHEVLVESPRFDYLLPLQTSDGTLWAIRRPWKAVRPPSALSMLLDVILIPWRIAKGIFGFLDAFTQMFGKERLRRAGAGDPEAPVQEMRALFLGQSVAPDRKSDQKAIRPPEDWVLVKIRPGCTEEEVARRVGWINLWEDRIVWSDGQSVRTLEGEELHRIRKGWIEKFCLT